MADLEGSTITWALDMGGKKDEELACRRDRATTLSVSQMDQKREPKAFIPERFLSEKLIALSIAILAFVYLCVFRQYTLMDPDEGIVLQGAERILSGQVLYRDFFSFFTPGSYYLYALLFQVVGNTFLVARTAVAIIGAGFAVITYLLARRVCSRGISLLITVLMTLTTLPFRFMVLHNWDSTFLACAAVYSAVRWLEAPRPSWAFATGSLISLTTLFEQSKGAGLILGLCLGFLIVLNADAERRKIVTLTQITVVATGLMWPVLCTVLYFTSQHALTSMIQGWTWPLQHYTTANRVPYAYQNLSVSACQALFFSGAWAMRVVKILAYSPSLWIPALPLFAVTLVARLVLTRKQNRNLDWAYYVVVSSAASGLLLSIVVVRPDIVHFVYLQPLLFLVLAWIIDGRGIRSKSVRGISAVLACLATFSLLTMGTALLVRVTGAQHVLTTRRGIVKLPQKDDVIERIQAQTHSGDRILSYPYSSMVYYLTETYSSTSFEYFQPGMHTSGQALELLAQLKAHPVNVVLYEPGFGEHIRDAWPNTRAIDLARDPVADYLAREYRPCASLASAADFHFLYMIRSDLACP